MAAKKLTPIRTLKLSTHTDHEASFWFALPGKAGSTRRGYLFLDPTNGRIHIMQGATVIASSYTAKEKAETARLNAEEPLKEGDWVTLKNDNSSVIFRVSKLEDYSGAGMLLVQYDAPALWTFAK